jgi:hypothetical protein
MVLTRTAVAPACLLIAAVLSNANSAFAFDLATISNSHYGWTDNSCGHLNVPGDCIATKGLTGKNRANISSDGSFNHPTSLAVAYPCLIPGKASPKTHGSTICPTTNTDYLQKGDLVFIPDLGWFIVEDWCGACDPGEVNEGKVDVWVATAEAPGFPKLGIDGTRDIQVFHPGEPIPASLMTAKANLDIWQALRWTDEDHMVSANADSLFIDLQLTPVSVQVSPSQLTVVPNGSSVQFTAVGEGATGTPLQHQPTFTWVSDDPIATIAVRGPSASTANVTVDTSNPGAGCQAAITATAGARSGQGHVTASGALCAAVTVSLTGNGYGIVTSSPAGISCPPTCTSNYTPGASVTLTATTSSTSTFSGWGGDCTGIDSMTVVTVDANKSCTFSEILSAPVAFSLVSAACAGGAQYTFNVSGPVGAHFGNSFCPSIATCGGWSPILVLSSDGKVDCQECMRQSSNQPVNTTITFTTNFIGSAFEDGGSQCIQPLTNQTGNECFMSMSTPNPC